MKSLIAAAVLAVIGQPAPDFKAPDLKGAEISLADQKGKVVVLEWTNFQCPFVKKHYASGNIPKLQEKYKGEGVVWITISSTSEKNSAWLKDDDLAKRAEKEGSKASYFINDPEGKIGRSYGAKVTPHMFIIDKEGTLVYDGAIDSKASTKAEDIQSADPLFTKALDAVLAGKEVPNAKNKPYGCSVKY